MGQLLDAEQGLTNIEYQISQETQAVKARHADQIQRLQASKAEAEKGLQDFAEANRAEWGENKSVKIGSGSIGYRLSKSLELLEGVDWDTVIIRCCKSFKEAVTKKTTWDVNKAKLKGCDNKLLEKLGVVVTEKDTFFCKSK